MCDNSTVMGSFTVALSAWAIATSAAPESAVKSVKPAAPPVATVEGEGVVLPIAEHTIAGFRMEGAAEAEIVFGDTDRLTRHVDRLFELHDQMHETRSRFGRHVKTALTLLAAHPRRGGCDYDALGPHYYQAHLEGERFRALGSGFEREHTAVRRLDRFGDTAALTPAYRWKVNRSRSLYSASLTDYKEMRVSFLDQLGREVQARRCWPARLLVAGAGKPTAAPETVTAPQRAPSRAPRPADAALESAPLPATFFIDNESCSSAMTVHIDGALHGRVAGGARTAFQTTAGRHTLCLIGADSVAQCGEPGTVRSAYFHDGWSIGVHCAGGRS